MADTSVRDAVEFLKTNREKGQEPVEAPSDDAHPTVAEDEAPAPDAEESASEQEDSPAPEAEDTAVDENQPSGEEDDETADDVEDQPIDPPASWTEEERDIWNSLPPELQESLSTRERERRAELDRRMSESDRLAQSIKDREKAIEQQRNEYAERLEYVEQLQTARVNEVEARYKGQFPDIQTWDDVRHMQQMDPMRYQEWQIIQQEYQSRQQEMQAIQQQSTELKSQKTAEQQKQAKEFYKTEADKFLQKHPEFSDPQRLPKLKQAVLDTMKNTGFSDEEIGSAFSVGGLAIDHRAREIIYKAALYDQAKNNVTTSKPKAAPSVQKPGGARNSKAEAKAEHLKSLDKALSRPGRRNAQINAGVELLRARRKG